MNELQGLHAVVTGGGSGIGAAVAARLLAAGARVTLMGRSLDKLQAQQALLGSDVAVQTVDIGDEASVKAAFAAVGPVDILVNNAGQVETAPLHRTSLALWQQLLNVNLTGTFLCSREVMAGMSERGFGRIINVASTAALKGYAYVAAYCAAKHGVVGLTRAMALELARKGVTVNAVCPGYTETDIVAQAVATISEKTGRSAEAARAELAASNPQGRLVQPEEVAASVLWLARRDSAAITGQAIAVCGGEVM
ncbi:SDR family NAD(P)-dependent oxidoreductase [Paucibacter sp. O1-1]|nr:SDR family oxidoreductase [Paucibacter sp. O1-1]MDA3824549.1 SDR family NAD(P)-dependent oxidoreductase [Paucibacter sp. O1-1]